MHDMMVLPPQELTLDIWNRKYRHKQPDGTPIDKDMDASWERTIRGIYAKDPSEKALFDALALAADRVIVPAGRQHAGAGTDKRVTLINCFVLHNIYDSMASEGPGKIGIMDSLRDSALTMQMGGGIGHDFSPIRPSGALVHRVGAKASGPVSFMEMWDTMCKKIMSAGARRGAMMATLRISHPDIIEFVTAKHKKDFLTQFNVSPLVTDAFMIAKDQGADWHLIHEQPPLGEQRWIKQGNEEGYWYKTMPARQLWEIILRSTYEYAEPGVLFIDRVNDLNNLRYCEYISATNPCGEQPLPPDGACCLGALNLVRFVTGEFFRRAGSAGALIDWARIRKAVVVAVRMLDNVLDVTPFPLPEQKHESDNKRRIGLGVTGLADMLAMLGVRYGSSDAINITRKLMKFIAVEAYQASAELAAERGPFPFYDKDQFLSQPFPSKMDGDVLELIARNGIRNGVVLTIAPQGTTSLYLDNPSSGMEPIYALTSKRNVLQEDGSRKQFVVEDYAWRLYKQLHFNGTEPPVIPEFFPTADDLTVEEHLQMQAACQEWVDASISKTINCPSSMTFEEFSHVYDRAYELGLKGCTTYRPSDTRGAVLEAVTAKAPELSATPTAAPIVLPPRDRVLPGLTYKLKWQGEENFYITITDKIVTGRRLPHEMFITTSSFKHADLTAVLTRTVSAIFRRAAVDGSDVTFLVAQFAQVHSPSGGMFLDGGRWVPSLVAAIGDVMREHLEGLGLIGSEPIPEVAVSAKVDSGLLVAPRGGSCTRCGSYEVVRQEGCSVCLSCGFSNCG